MNPVFINSYDITEKIYLDWATHPLGKLAKKHAYMSWGIYIAEFVIAVGLIIWGLLGTNPLYLLVGAVVVLYLPIKIFYLDRNKHRRQFRMLLAQKKKNVWHRDVRVGEEHVEVNDPGDKKVVEYEQITDVTENGDWYCLWLGPSSAYRLKRDGFKKGNSAEFIEYIKARINK